MISLPDKRKFTWFIFLYFILSFSPSSYFLHSYYEIIIYTTLKIVLSKFFVMLEIVVVVVMSFILPNLSQSNQTNNTQAVVPVPMQPIPNPPEVSDPTTLTCDMTKPCPPAVFCNGGKCSCPGNGIYSVTRRACKMRAGGKGCTASGDCSDGGRCWHGRERFRRWDPFFLRWRWVYSEWTQCHCCEGHLAGNNGKCPPSQCLPGGSSTNFKFSFYSLFISIVSVCILNVTL